MDFSTMQLELSDRVSVYDQTITEDVTKLKRWLNLAQQDIAGEWDWPFLIQFDIIPTVADISTGTVSINAADTAGTFSSAPAASVANSFIKFSTSDNWYEITAHTAGATAFTIDPVYGESSNLTAGTYTVRKIFYSMATTMDLITDVHISESRRNLKSMAPRTAEFFLPFLDSTGKPSFYFQTIPSSTGTPRIGFYPSADEVLNVYIRGKMQITDLSADSDVTFIPKSYHKTMLDKATYYALMTVDDTRAQRFLSEYEKGIDKMKRVYSQDKGRHRVMGRSDITDVGPAQILLPAEFGPMTTGPS